MNKIPTENQQQIIDYVAGGKSVIVTAVAGSGKTFTCAKIAEMMPEKRVLCLTYSANLKEEGRQRTEHLNNMEYTNYHSFILRWGGRPCHDDEMFNKAVRDLQLPRHKYEVIIVDETQDMKDDYFKLFYKIIEANPQAQLVLVGDVLQAIFETIRSLPSDSRYLTEMDKILGRNFEKVYMDESFRYSQEVCDFVGRGRSRVSHKTDIIEIDLGNISAEIERLITKEGFTKKDILVISNAPKNVGYKLESRNDKYPLYVSGVYKEDASKYKRNKVEVISVHKAKGLERPIIFYINAHSGGDGDEHSVKILDYVAKTRAINKLYLTRLSRARQKPKDSILKYKIDGLVTYQHAPYFEGITFTEFHSPFKDYSFKVDRIKEFDDGDRIIENVAIHIDYASRRKAFPNYRIKLKDYLDEKGIPHNGLDLDNWEQYADDELVKRLKEIQPDNSTTEYPLSDKINSAEISGTVNLIDHDRRIVYHLLIQNTEYALHHKLFSVCYKALMVDDDLKAYDYVVANVCADIWLRLDNTQEECRRAVEIMIDRKSANRISDEQFISNTKILMQDKSLIKPIISKPKVDPISFVPFETESPEVRLKALQKEMERLQAQILGSCLPVKQVGV